MAITRGAVETVLIRRTRLWMAESKMDCATVSGNNKDLAEPISWSMRQCGYSVASIADATAAEVATVADTDADKLLDYAEWRLLNNILQNFALVDVSEGPHSESFNQFRLRLEEAIARKDRYMKATYGTNIGTISGGEILLNFQEAGE